MLIGTDIVEVSRIEKAILNGETHFLQRVFTEKEIVKINPGDINFQRASGFWAAKESAVKAMGLGFSNGIVFQDIEIDHDSYGCPFLNISGNLKKAMEARNVSNTSLSISHCSTHAVAVTIIF